MTVHWLGGGAVVGRRHPGTGAASGRRLVLLETAPSREGAGGLGRPTAGTPPDRRRRALSTRGAALEAGPLRAPATPSSRCCPRRCTRKIARLCLARGAASGDDELSVRRPCASFPRRGRGPRGPLLRQRGAAWTPGNRPSLSRHQLVAEYRRSPGVPTRTTNWNSFPTAGGIPEVPGARSSTKFSWSPPPGRACARCSIPARWVERTGRPEDPPRACWDASSPRVWIFAASASRSTRNRDFHPLPGASTASSPGWKVRAFARAGRSVPTAGPRLGERLFRLRFRGDAGGTGGARRRALERAPLTARASANRVVLQVALKAARGRKEPSGSRSARPRRARARTRARPMARLVSRPRGARRREHP